jgi:hypothetical protein
MVAVSQILEVSVGNAGLVVVLTINGVDELTGFQMTLLRVGLGPQCLYGGGSLMVMSKHGDVHVVTEGSLVLVYPSVLGLTGMCIRGESLCSVGKEEHSNRSQRNSDFSHCLKLISFLSL